MPKATNYAITDDPTFDALVLAEQCQGIVSVILHPNDSSMDKDVKNALYAVSSLLHKIEMICGGGEGRVAECAVDTDQADRLSSVLDLKTRHLSCVTYLIQAHLHKDGWLEDDELDLVGCFALVRDELKEIRSLSEALPTRRIVGLNKVKSSLEKAASINEVIWNAYEGHQPEMVGHAIQLHEAVKEMSVNAESMEVVEKEEA